MLVFPSCITWIFLCAIKDSLVLPYCTPGWPRTTYPSVKSGVPVQMSFGGKSNSMQRLYTPYVLVTVSLVGQIGVEPTASRVQGELLTPRILPVIICWHTRNRTWIACVKDKCNNRYTMHQFCGRDRIRTYKAFTPDAFQERLTTTVHSSVNFIQYVNELFLFF